MDISSLARYICSIVNFDVTIALFYYEVQFKPLTLINRNTNMTFIEFKKHLLDIEMSLPKFCSLIKVSDKNIQSYKKKGEVPNTIAVIITCFKRLHEEAIDYKSLVHALDLKKKTKKGGFYKKKDQK